MATTTTAPKQLRKTSKKKHRIPPSLEFLAVALGIAAWVWNMNFIVTLAGVLILALMIVHSIRHHLPWGYLKKVINKPQTITTLKVVISLVALCMLGILAKAPLEERWAKDHFHPVPQLRLNIGGMARERLEYRPSGVKDTESLLEKRIPSTHMPSRPEHTTAFLQIQKPEILQQYSLIAPAKQFGGNIRSQNPGPERVFQAFGFTRIYVENVNDDTDKNVRIKFEKELYPKRKDYLAGKIKGPEIGVGLGIWGTVTTPPLTQEQFDGLVSGSVRIYFVSWLAWTDVNGKKDSTYDCRWLQTPTGPYKKDEIVWHFCQE
jgi:hypothetical protein